MVESADTPDTSPLAKKRRRFSKEERTRQMLEAAVHYFAQNGFETSTRAFAGSIGVDQALIYRHFASKEALITATLDQAVDMNITRADTGEDTRPIREIVLERYQNLVTAEGFVPMLLLIRAGLSRLAWPAIETTTQTGGYLFTLIASLRRSAGLPALDDVALMRGERELVMTVHAPCTYLAIRRHIFDIDLPDDLQDLVAYYVDTFFASATDNLRRLHKDGPAFLQVPYDFK